MQTKYLFIYIYILVRWRFMNSSLHNNNCNCRNNMNLDYICYYVWSIGNFAAKTWFSKMFGWI